MGGTIGIADMIAAPLREAGYAVDERPVDQVTSLDGYDAVFVGGAIYNAHWHPGSRHFVKRFMLELRERPVWFFSSGPLDDSAADHEIPPVRGVAKLMTTVNARGHATIGGRIVPKPGEAHAHKPPDKARGDWRDQEQITKWVKSVMAQLPPVVAMQ
jgi:menaquinone-dependent protoporphyrinogen oxidase